VRPKVFVLGNFVQACCWNVPRLPLPGETLVATGVHIEPGGKGLNVAVCLHRLGVEVNTLIGCGADAAGASLMALLKGEAMSTNHVYTFAGASGWGSGWIAADGQNAIAVYPGANLLLADEHVAQAAADITQAQLVYGQFETALPAVEAAFALAHANGVTTVLNPSPWQTPSPKLRQSTHTVIVNESEAIGLLAMATPLTYNVSRSAQQIEASLSSFWRDWPSLQCLVVTLGAMGSLGFDRSQPSFCLHASAPAIVAIDTVGAGDAFASGYCAARLSGESLETALRWGNACGGHLASKAGVLAALPNAQTLTDLLRNDQSISVNKISL
jgi:ribokinase